MCEERSLCSWCCAVGIWDVGIRGPFQGSSPRAANGDPQIAMNRQHMDHTGMSRKAAVRQTCRFGLLLPVVMSDTRLAAPTATSATTSDMNDHHAQGTTTAINKVTSEQAGEGMLGSHLGPATSIAPTSRSVASGPAAARSGVRWAALAVDLIFHQVVVLSRPSPSAWPPLVQTKKTTSPSEKTSLPVVLVLLHEHLRGLQVGPRS